ncbi:MAG: His/Gly/Thr/Pro-type tRNA ligase C-terminal domain-containing protein, partial [Brachybacterium alimentarium]
FKDAELLGIPTSVVVGKGLTTGVVEVRDRATGAIDEVAVQDAVQAVVAEVRED